jgi:hypothetical protein
VADAAKAAGKQREVPGIPFTKGDPRINRQGKAVGCLDRITHLRNTILDASEEMEPGERRTFVQKLAKEYPVAFAGLLGRLLPNKVEVEGNQRLDIMFPCDSPEDLARKTQEAMARAKKEA